MNFFIKKVYEILEIFLYKIYGTTRSVYDTLGTVCNFLHEENCN